MEITSVRVYPVSEDKLRAFATIIIDSCFVITDIKIIRGSTGLFISMPSKRRKDGTFKDVAHPINSGTRRMIEDRIISEYEKIHGVGSASATLIAELDRRPDDTPIQ